MKYIVLIVLLLGCASTKVEVKEKKCECRTLKYYDSFFEKCINDECTECIDTASTKFYEEKKKIK